MATDNMKAGVQQQLREGVGSTVSSDHHHQPFAAASATSVSCGPRASHSLAPGVSGDLALLRLASSASVDLRFRRAESLLPCGLTSDELQELLERVGGGGDSHVAPKTDGGSQEGGGEGVPAAESDAKPAAHIGGGVVVTAGGPAGAAEITREDERAAA